MGLGNLLKNGRNAQNLTRQQLADIVGANVNSIAKYERAGKKNGQYPPLPMLAKITKILRLPTSEIFAEVSEDEEDKKYFKTGPLRSLAPVLSTLFWMEEIWSDMDVNLSQAKDELRTVLPKRVDRDQFNKDLLQAFPAERDFRRTLLDNFFFAEDTSQQQNGPDQKDPSRSMKPKNNAEAVSAASTRPKKGKPDEAV